jgi:nucleoside-diphosphate-sugar epimerase
MTDPSATAPILVTGGTGFIGRRLVDRLLSAGCAVRVLALPDEDLPPAWGTAVEVHRGSLADPAAVRAAVEGTGLAFHLAAVVGDWGAESLFREITVEGTRRVLGPAHVERIPVVLASSIVVYGDRLGREVCDEDLEHGRPYGPYSRAKQAQERLARDYLELGADIRIVRPANVYGPGSRVWLDEVAAVLRRGTPALIDGGRQNAGLVYVDHVADILLRAGGPRAQAGGIYNACDELDVTWARYLGDVAGLVGAPAPRSVPSWLAWPLATGMEGLWRALGREQRPALTREALHLISADHRVPGRRARAELGHEPSVGYADAIIACRADLARRGLFSGEPTDTGA